jgi:hypothetical protein
LLVAIVWAVIGLALAWISARTGMPTLSGWLAFLTGPVALVLVGRRQALRGAREWILAAVIAIGAVVIIGGAAIVASTLLTYG